MAELIEREFQLGPESAGRRLDQVLSELLPEYSRARLQQWTRDGQIVVDGRKAKPSFKLKGVETVAARVEVLPAATVTPQDLPLDLIHSDADVLVINKPAGLVVHPAAGNPDGTLQNALLFHDPDLAAVPRAGIVHRLDRLTSGVMVVARNLRAHHSLVAQLQARSMKRLYRTVVHGPMVAGDRVDAPIGRHPKDRTRMAVVDGGKPAITHYRIARKYRDFTALDVSLETGRTHQIRVHMAYIRHPLIGDPVYGARFRPPKGGGEALLEILAGFRRQALHARRLSFEHPATGESVAFEAPLADDLQALLNALDDDPSQKS